MPPVTMAVRPSKEKRDVISGGAVDIFAMGTNIGRGLRRLDESVVKVDSPIEIARDIDHLEEFDLGQDCRPRASAQDGAGNSSKRRMRRHELPGGKQNKHA